MWLHLLSLRLINGASSADAVAVKPTFSNEIVIRPVYIRRGKKILLFADNAQADIFLDAEAAAQEAIDKAQSRQARRKVKQRVYESIKTVDIDLLGQLAQQYAMSVDIPALVADQQWAQLVQIALDALQMQDEDDIEMLLLSN